MKHLPIIPIIASLLFSVNLFAQSNVQIGASGVFSKTTGQGAEIVANLQAAKNLSIGFGTRPIKFENHSNLYVPVFATVKYYYPLPKWKLFASLDPGYSIYSSEDLSDGSYSYYRNGAIYLSGGVGIMGTSKIAPYGSIYFTKYGFTEHLGSAKYRPISTFTFSAGIALNRSATQNVFRQINKPVALPGKDDYYNKSRRQKNVARILLGTGIALIGTSIAVASHERDAISKGVTLFFIGGPGIISSLASIPFFIASGRNKSKQ